MEASHRENGHDTSPGQAGPWLSRNGCADNILKGRDIADSLPDNAADHNGLVAYRKGQSRLRKLVKLPLGELLNLLRLFSPPGKPASARIWQGFIHHYIGETWVSAAWMWGFGNHEGYRAHHLAPRRPHPRRIFQMPPAILCDPGRPLKLRRLQSRGHSTRATPGQYPCHPSRIPCR